MWQQGGGYGQPVNQWVVGGGGMDPYMGYYCYEDPTYAAMRQLQAAQMYMQAGPQPGDPWSEQQAQYDYMQAAAAAAAAGNYGSAASAQQPLQQGQRASSASPAAGGQATPGQPKPLVGVLKRPSKIIIPVDLPKAPESDDEEDEEEDDEDDNDRRRSKSRRRSSSSSSSSSSRSRSHSERSSSKVRGSSSKSKSSSSSASSKSSRSGSSKSKSSDGRRHRCPLCYGGETYDNA